MNRNIDSERSIVYLHVYICMFVKFEVCAIILC
jgi:hypothetical protein